MGKKTPLKFKMYKVPQKKKKSHDINQLKNITHELETEKRKEQKLEVPNAISNNEILLSIRPIVQ